MKAIYSPGAGVIVAEPYDSDAPTVIQIADGEAWTRTEAKFLLSVCNDWESGEFSSREELVRRVSREHELRRAESYVIALLGGLTRSLEQDVLEFLESSLQGRIAEDSLLNNLLIAPLHDPSSASGLAATALGNGLAAVGAMFHALADLQPLLSRIASAWLALPSEAFEEWEFEKAELWSELVARGILKELLKCSHEQEFKAAWSKLIFETQEPARRAALVRISTLLSDRLFPSSSARGRRHDQPTAEVDEKFQSIGTTSRPRPHINPKDALDRALKQVDAVAEQVALGRDAHAERFLRQLIQSQLKMEGGDEYAIKSLCNIAKRCADMFRTDFERECLEAALSLDPNDAWTLIQFGDHLKRIGDFDKAIEFFKRAAVFKYEDVACSSIADVWSERGEYAKAIEIYKSISGWESTIEIRTAIADNLRRLGDVGSSEKEYQSLLATWGYSHRPIAGLAEIAKMQGHFGRALELYDEALVSPEIDERFAQIYKLSKCHLLKIEGRLDEAFRLANQIVQECPFLMEARIVRGSVLGLLNRETAGLKDIPASELPSGVREWIRQYYRGLLLLKLNEYQEARQQLVDRLEAAHVSGNQKALLRLGASLAFLWADDIQSAEVQLSQLGTVKDLFSKYISHVLELHIAVARSDEARIAKLVRQLSPAATANPLFADAVAALQNRELQKAREIEWRLLLQAA